MWDDPLLDSPTKEDWSAIASTILKAVISARERWRFATIVAPSELWQEGFNEESEWCISDLKYAQELRIGDPNVRFEGQPELRRDPGVDGRFVLDISSATKLERLTLSHLYKSTVRVDNAFPRLRSFRVKRRSRGEVPLSTIFQILQLSPALEEVCWPILTHSKLRILNEGLPGLRLENLRSLALHYVYSRGVKDHDRERRKLAHVLEHLTLPQLQNFYLGVDHRSGGERELVAVRDMFLRSEPPLVSLTLKLYDIDTTNEGLIDCLLSAPLVEKLALGLRDIDYRSLFERMTVYPPGSPNSRPRICTRLTSFAIYGWHLGDELQHWLDAAVEMALSRSPVDNERYTDADSVAGLGRYGTSVLNILDIRTEHPRRREEAFENAELVQLVARGLVWEMASLYDGSAPRLKASIFDDETDDETSVW
jgi:hypothetical protein